MESTMTLEWASIDTPVGPVSVACGDAGVAEVRFGAPPAGTGPAKSTTPSPAATTTANPAASTTPATGLSATVRDARRQLAEYFSGQRKEFDLPIDWSGFGPAQRQVLGRLYDDVGYGETVTYGTLAGRAGIPASTDVIPARAVGQIMGSNPIPVIVPCHRVVASDGLGGYSGGAGPEVKRWLLILEGSLPPTLDWVPASPPVD
ncbi:MAG TPA: methylated-DNA--[protein]-cysteine S-methyltransferase [Streptosporangiaceae bacterium]|nr:methylated-DNA--[protein]-cysteine S-methyltransferase [Streptosporangiaceae bacterium]